MPGSYELRVVAAEAGAVRSSSGAALMAEPLRRGETTLKVGASVGIAMLGDAQTDFDSLLRAADAAMSLNALALLVNVLAEAHRVPLWFLAAVKSRASQGWAGVEDARRAYEDEIARSA